MLLLIKTSIAIYRVSDPLLHLLINIFFCWSPIMRRTLLFTCFISTHHLSVGSSNQDNSRGYSCTPHSQSALYNKKQTMLYVGNCSSSRRQPFFIIKNVFRTRRNPFSLGIRCLDILLLSSRAYATASSLVVCSLPSKNIPSENPAISCYV